jgi:hypothetical protein
MMGKPKQDIEDINFILNEIGKFSSMTPEDIGIHIKQPPFDMLYTINLATGKHIPIGHEAALRFNKIAKRHCELHNYNDIDVLALEREIENEFAKTFIEDKRPNEKKFIDRMLNRAVKATQNNHKTNTHYLPCVITRQGQPSEFRIGPVRFLTTDKFFKDFGAKFEKDYTSYGITGRTIITKIYDYYKSFIWVAEVTVPLCDDKISEERALQVVQGALDVLKLCFPHSHSHDLRMGYHHSNSEDTAKITRTSDGMFHPGVGWHGYGVPTNPMWFNDIMSNNKWYLDCAGNAIESYLKPESKSENLDRWLRALYWYGQAVSDDLPGVQLVKYVAALECLTVTPSDGIEDVTDIVTRRTALLIAQDYKDDVFEKTYANARRLYRWRSDLMHGRISPIKKDIDSIVSLAHEIVPQMMLIVLNMFWCLEMNGRNSSKDLFNEYRSLERQLPKEGK